MEKTRKNDKTPGERVKALRKRYGITQGELAERMCVSQDLVSMIERGTRKLQIDQAERLSDVFRVRKEFLLGFDDFETENDRISFIDGRDFDRKEMIEHLIALHGYRVTVEQGEGVSCHLQYPPGLSDEEILERAHDTAPEPRICLSAPSGRMTCKIIDQSEYFRILKGIDDFIEMIVAFQFRTPTDGAKEYWG